MDFKSGKHEGMTTEAVLLKEPDFAEWYWEHYPDAPHGRDFKRLAAWFDQKPLIKKCSCKKPATRASGYRGSPSLMFWCATCDPYSSGANAGKLVEITTLEGALNHINHTANANRSFKRMIVKELAQAKGLPRRVGKVQALAFFK